MKIRARVSLWYASALSASLLVMTGVLYYELVWEVEALAAAGKPEQPIEEEIAEAVLIYGIPTALVLLLGGQWIIGKALAPLDKLTSAAERIHINNLHERLPRLGNNDELDRLTEVFNGMMARLQGTFAQIQEFTLHASHELKTPLAILHGELESMMNEAQTSEAQREAIAGHLDEIQRLSRIVEGLTLLAKADTGQITLSREWIPFHELVQDSCEDAEILAAPKRIQVRLKECEEALLWGDRHRLRQLLLNLSDNAVKYNEPDGKITVSLTRKNGDAELRISNSSSGIAPEILPRVFDRFFRGDSSHNSQPEGCGLGLSIAQWIVKAHGGSLHIASQPRQITTVTVNLPLSDRIHANAVSSKS